MLKRILHIWQRIELKEFASAGQVLSTSVQIDAEVLKLAAQVSISLLLTCVAHEGRIHGEVDL